MPPLALRSLIEKLRSLGYPTVPSYHLGPEDIEGLDLEEEEEEEEAADARGEAAGAHHVTSRVTCCQEHTET